MTMTPMASTMTVRDIVADPSLLPVLQTSADAHAECQKLLALLEPSTTLTSNHAADVSKQQKILFALLAQLRGLNRDAILQVRDTKQLTAEARQEIDRLHLQLQNLFYEQKHLMGEIAACESYEYATFFSLLHVYR
jgi:THO complex subunit 5